MRLFFALWPDAATRDALAAAARDLRSTCGGRSPPAANLHLTLAFLGAVAEPRLPLLTQLAGTLPAETIELTLDHIGCWRAQQLVWAGVRHCPRALSALVDVLTGGLQAQGFRTERRSFKPHVTLLRDVVTEPTPAQAMFGPLRWTAQRLVLAGSEPAARGVCYRIIGEWPLTAAGL